MRPKHDRPDHDSKTTSPPSKRFRIEKLEERIAPKKGGKGTNNCGTANCGSDGTNACSGY